MDSNSRRVCLSGLSNFRPCAMLHILGWSPPTAFEAMVRDEVLVSVFSGTLAQLSCSKVALVRYFSCSKLELRPRVAIAYKLERLVQETTRIREPWGPLVVFSLHSNATAQGPSSSLMHVVSCTRHLTI